MIAPPAICNRVIPSPSTLQAASAEKGGWARITSATIPTDARPIAIEVSPCPSAWTTKPSSATIIQPNALDGMIFSPCSQAAAARTTAETAAVHSVAATASSLRRSCLIIRR